MSDRSRWALLRGARDAWQRLRDGWRDLPPGAGRSWLVTVAIGLLLSGGLTWLLVALARARLDHGLQAWDESVLRRLEQGGLIAFNEGIWWQTFGTSAMLVPVAVVAALLALRRDRVLLALSFVCAYVLQKPLVFLGWTLWDRARPTMIQEGIASPPLQAYPSGHVVQAVGIYGLLAWLWMHRSGSVLERLLALLLWLALVGMVGLARLRLGTHWPSDEIAGALIGLALLTTLIVALHRADAVPDRS